jgi:ribosomal protein S18 acetylase RimI-like enzyme
MSQIYPPIRAVPYGSDEYRRIVDFRYEWLRKPMGQVFTPEQLAADPHSEHYLVEDSQRIIGCVLLQMEFPELARLRQLVVHPDWRGRGLGAHLTQHFEEKARAHGATQAVLSAREYAIPFYEKLGYVAVGDIYLSVDIPHRKMVKSLT